MVSAQYPHVTTAAILEAQMQNIAVITENGIGQYCTRLRSADLKCYDNSEKGKTYLQVWNS